MVLKTENKLLISHLYLEESLKNDVLVYLNISFTKPTIRSLNRLIHAYIRKVPWESVSRIVKRHTTPETIDCPRWPEEFWKEAIRNSYGGTCYESSLAFYSLLKSLGFEGYLTVNDMGTSRGCHAAIVILIEGKKYLVDITIPLHCAVQINPQKITSIQTLLYNYTIKPVQKNIYEVDRYPHPQRYAFTLIDVPVSLQEYQTVVEDDYGETGRFLKSVVMVKVIGEKTWRFFSDYKPYRLESFNREGKSEIFVEPENLAYKLSELFLIPEDQISKAFSLIEEPLPQETAQSFSFPRVLERVAQ